MEEKKYLNLEMLTLYDSLIKKFVDSQLFIGTHEEYETANANNLIPLNALVVITDDETSTAGGASGGSSEMPVVDISDFTVNNETYMKAITEEEYNSINESNIIKAIAPTYTESEYLFFHRLAITNISGLSVPCFGFFDATNNIGSLVIMLYPMDGQYFLICSMPTETLVPTSAVISSGYTTSNQMVYTSSAKTKEQVKLEPIAVYIEDLSLMVYCDNLIENSNSGYTGDNNTFIKQKIVRYNNQTLLVKCDCSISVSDSGVFSNTFTASYEILEDAAGGGSALTVAEELPETPDETAIYKVGGGLAKQAVPNTGYVDKVYFNTSLSEEEIEEICSNITLNLDSAMEAVVLSSDFAKGIAIVDLELMDYGIGYGIVDAGMTYFYYISTKNENSEGVPFIGWNSEFNGILDVNSEVIAESEGIPIGTQNELLKDLLYIQTEVEPNYSVVHNNKIKNIVFDGNVPALTVVEELPVTPNERAIYKVGGGLTKKAVPNSGTVDKIYFDTNLSIEEVEGIINKLTNWLPVDNTMTIYPIYMINRGTSDVEIEENDAAVAIFKYNDENNQIRIYDIQDYTLIWCNVDEGSIKSGWQDISEHPEITDAGLLVTNVDGKTFGTQNALIKELVYIQGEAEPSYSVIHDNQVKNIVFDDNVPALTVVEELPATPDEKVIYKIDSIKAVPNTGFVEKVYFNTSLSNEEVEALVDKICAISNIDDTIPGDYVLFAFDQNKPIGLVLMIGIEGTTKGIMGMDLVNNTQLLIWASEVNEDLGVTTPGWQNFTNPIEINAEVLPDDSSIGNEFGGITVGTNNELIKDLFYIGGVSYGVYDKEFKELAFKGDLSDIPMIDLSAWTDYTTTYQLQISEAQFNLYANTNMIDVKLTNDTRRFRFNRNLSLQYELMGMQVTDIRFIYNNTYNYDTTSYEHLIKDEDLFTIQLIKAIDGEETVYMISVATSHIDYDSMYSYSDTIMENGQDFSFHNFNYNKHLSKIVIECRLSDNGINAGGMCHPMGYYNGVYRFRGVITDGTNNYEVIYSGTITDNTYSGTVTYQLMEKTSAGYKIDYISKGSDFTDERIVDINNALDINISATPNGGYIRFMDSGVALNRTNLYHIMFYRLNITDDVDIRELFKFSIGDSLYTPTISGYAYCPDDKEYYNLFNGIPTGYAISGCFDGYLQPSNGSLELRNVMLHKRSS